MLKLLSLAKEFIDSLWEQKGTPNGRRPGPVSGQERARQWHDIGSACNMVRPWIVCGISYSFGQKQNDLHGKLPTAPSEHPQAQALCGKLNQMVFIYVYINIYGYSPLFLFLMWDFLQHKSCQKTKKKNYKWKFQSVGQARTRSNQTRPRNAASRQNCRHFCAQIVVCRRNWNNSRFQTAPFFLLSSLSPFQHFSFFIWNIFRIRCNWRINFVWFDASTKKKILNSLQVACHNCPTISLCLSVWLSLFLSHWGHMHFNIWAVKY